VHHVTGEDVIVFVEGKGLAMNNKGYKESLNDKKGKNCGPRPSR